MKPCDIPVVYRRLKREFDHHQAPIVDLIKAQTHDPFLILVATILSTRTKDETTATVCRRLFDVVRRPADLDARTVPDIEKLIFPIGFYRTKARHLKALPAALRASGGKVPDTFDALCALPGVGRKVANLVLAQAFGHPAICVDVHVHRISNRLGLIRTRTPFDTEMSLRKLLPVRMWRMWNSCLVSFGQTVCRPVGPHCGRCVITDVCDRVGVATPSRLRCRVGTGSARRARERLDS